MRDTRWARYFHGAVLMALSLPTACGGKVVVVEQAAGVGTLVPPASCDWKSSPVGTCAWSFTFKGDATTCVGFAASGTTEECLEICGKGNAGDAPTSCTLGAPDASNVVTLQCNVTAGPDCQPQQPPPGNGGRRPGYFASLGFGRALPGREVGTHFARVACMEAGSVEAFRTLRDELAAHRAPRRLVRAASRAMRDELRHVRQTAALARRFGEEPIAPIPPPPRPARSLEAIARENALEGCVRETYSALECAWQSTKSADPVVRATMARIAKDEMRHLALSWDVHRWAMSRLDREGSRAIQRAQREELAALTRELAADPAEPLVTTVGLPLAFQSRALIDAIDAQVETARAA